MRQDRLEQLRSRVIVRTEMKGGCQRGLQAAYNAKTIEELGKVCKDAFEWVARTGVVDEDLMKEYQEESNGCGIYCNQNVKNGWVLATKKGITASGFSVVIAIGEAEVTAEDDTVVHAFGRSRIIAKGHSSIEAHDQTHVKALGNSRIILYEEATAIGQATSYIQRYSDGGVALEDEAILREKSTGQIIKAKEQ